MGITAIVAGALANKPSNGGNAWTRLQWVLGLGRLGVQVQFVEQIDSGACVDVAGAACTFDASAQRAYFRAVAEAFGLTAQMSLICTGSDDVEGLGLDELRR